MTNSLYHQHATKIQSYLKRFVAEEDANDLTQEVFIKANKHLDQFRGDADIKAWLYRIASNTAKDFLKSKTQKNVAKTQSIDDSELARFTPDDEDLPELVLSQQEMNACVHESIYRLSYDYSSVLVLSEIEGYKMREIAGILAIEEGTVKVRLHRARARLRQELERGCTISINCSDRMQCQPKVSYSK